jgi:hypothetical protein
MNRRAVNKLPALLLAGVVFSASCFAGQVKVFVSESADFASFKTYQWFPTKVLTKSGIVENDPVLTPIIKSAIDRELRAKGLTEVADGGDLQVATCVLDTYIPQLEMYIFPMGVPYDYPTPLAAMGRYNREGSLIVNLIDSRSKKSAWTGMATESLKDKPGGGAAKIPTAAAKLFKKYPVKK